MIGNYLIMLPGSVIAVFLLRTDVAGVWIMTNIGTVFIFTMCFRKMSKISFEDAAEAAGNGIVSDDSIRSEMSARDAVLSR